MIKIDICSQIDEIIAIEVEKFLSQQRETYSIIQNSFGEENTDFIINRKLLKPIKLEELLNYLGDNVNISSNDWGYDSFDRVHCLCKYIRNIQLSVRDIKENTFSKTALLDILFNRVEITKDTYKFLRSDTYTIEHYFYTDELSRQKVLKLLFNDIIRVMTSKALREFFFEDGNYASSTVLIKFNEITLKNENNKTHTIYDTFVRVNLLPHEIIDCFKLVRASVTKSEYRQNYSHSHANGGIFKFCVCCLGTGPINETITRLKSRFVDSKKYLIDIFCFELDNYLKVESLTGVPYHKLEELSNAESVLLTNFKNVYLVRDLSLLMKDFYKWILLEHNKELYFTINYGKILLGMTFAEIMVTFTNLFNKYLEENNINRNDVLNYFINSTISSLGCTIFNNTDITIPNNSLVCIFKNEKIFSKEITTVNPNEILILDPSIVGTLINEILIFLNFNYEK